MRLISNISFQISFLRSSSRLTSSPLAIVLSKQRTSTDCSSVSIKHWPPLNTARNSLVFPSTCQTVFPAGHTSGGKDDYDITKSISGGSVVHFLSFETIEMFIFQKIFGEISAY